MSITINNREERKLNQIHVDCFKRFYNRETRFVADDNYSDNSNMLSSHSDLTL